MQESEVRRGLDEVSALSTAEYHESLRDIMADADQARSALRIGRLAGVLLKEPFATATDEDTPSARTGAYRSWRLDAKEKFEAQASTWQYAALARLMQESRSPGQRWPTEEVYYFATGAASERGFFACLARAVRSYLCGDPEIRQKVAESLAKVPGGKVTTPEAVVGAGGLSLGVYLVEAVPVLGVVGAPVIAALIVIVYLLGVRGFCAWTEHLGTDSDERV